MSKAKGRPQQERRLAVVSIAPTEAAPRWSPNPERVEDYPVEIPLLGQGRIVGRQGLDIESQRLVEFSLSSQVMESGEWYEVARVDTRHEEVHLHVRSRSGLYIHREMLFPVTGPHDVDRGYSDGEKLLLVNWETYERMWRRGR